MSAKRTIGWGNFHDGTRASFTRWSRPFREPDFVSYSGSEYWDIGSGVVRCSNHWGYGIKSCDWLLDGKEVNGFLNSESIAGYCAWASFTDKWSEEFRAAQCINALNRQRKRFTNNPELAALEYFPPSAPVSGRGYRRVELPWKFSSKQGREAAVIWDAIPASHRLEWFGKYAMRAVSPEAWELFRNIKEQEAA